MRARALIPCILLSILVILLLSTATQATEYREVKAEDILKQIENGEDVNLTDCRIVGELNVSKIELESVPNQNYDKLLKEEYTEEDLINMGLKENLSIIKRNIKITNSIFENNSDFSSIQFNNTADFSMATFNNYADFNGATFNNYAKFNGTTFNDYADFNGATFNNDAKFNEATFNNYAYFCATFNNSPDFFGATFNNDAYFDRATFNNDADFFGATFNNDAKFQGATFNNSADFCMATFNNSADFFGETFNNSVDFSMATFNNSPDFFGATFNNDAKFNGATFNNDADFSTATFNNDAYFGAPEKSENIFTNGKNCELFMKYYNDLTRYSDADNIYYNFRKYEQEKKSVTDFSKWTDILSWVTCGYGTKLSYTLYCTIFFIAFFAYIYSRQHTTVTVVGVKKIEPYKIEPLIEIWNESGIYRLSDTAEKKLPVSRWECLYFSANTFTRLGSADWHARDNFRKWVTLEGLLGWIMLALVMATLMRLFIRS